MKRGTPIAALALLALIGCGDGTSTTPSPVTGTSGPSVTMSGNVITQTRPVGSFHSLRVTVPGRVIVEHGASSDLEITGGENALSLITADVVDGELVVAQVPNTDLRLDDPFEIEYRVTIERLVRIDVSGTVRATVTGIHSPELDVSVSGASSIVASGTTERQNVLVTGSSRYEADALPSRDVTLDVSGSAFVAVTASDTIRGQIRGSAIVVYRGSPSVSVSVSGSATVGPR